MKPVLLIVLTSLGIGALASAIHAAVLMANDGKEATNPEVWIGLAITLVLAALPTVVAWGKLTERLNSVSKAQDQMVRMPELQLALSEMKNDMLEKLLTARKKDKEGD